MTDPTSDAPKSAPADLSIRAARQPIRGRMSLVWLVPILALVVSLGVALKAYSDRGPLIEVAFRDATGIVPGETMLKFREVAVGVAESVRFSEDLREVLVAIRVSPDVAPFIDTDAQFWLVSPEVSARGISRLDTVLTGAFIEGQWDVDITTPSARFTALENPPVARFADGGTTVQLNIADASSLSEGAPVLFRGLEVGTLSNLRLDGDGAGALVDAFVQSPHDLRLTTGTRFWDISGFSVSVGASGLSFDVRSIAALVSGGIEFADIVSGGQPIQPGHAYRLYDDEEAARAAILLDDTETAVQVSLLLDGSILGLSIGDDVQYRGLRVGLVSDFSAVISDGPHGRRDVGLLISLSLQPGRLGLRADTTYAETLAFLSERVALGLRGRIASTGLFGTTLIVELVELPDAPVATIDFGYDPLPLLPSTASNIADASSTAEGLLSRVGALPIEELMQAAIRLFNVGTDLVGRDSTQAAPDRLVEILDQVSALINSDDVQAIPATTRTAIDELSAFLIDLRTAALPAQIATFIQTASEAVDAVTLAAEGVPPVLVGLGNFAEMGAALPLAELTTRANDLLTTLDTVFGSPEVAALPGEVGNTLVELRGALIELREGGAVESVNTALAAARSAAESVAETASRLPSVLERLESAVRGVDGVIAAYGERSDFNEETIGALREIRRAAAAAGSLARTLERDPSALILGR
jgi:paraquat-inducible protein B